MSQIFKAAEEKVRPGVYYRHSSRDRKGPVGAIDGIVAIVMRSGWGPINTVTSHDSYESALSAYGDSVGMKAIKCFFDAGATTVRVCRIASESSPGAPGEAAIGEFMSVTAKYAGDYPIKVKTQNKPGDSSKWQCLILVNGVVKETYTVEADTASPAAELAAVINKQSAYINAESKEAAITATEANLTSGTNPGVTNADYAAGFYALEPYPYNVIITDTEDEAVDTLLAEYINHAHDNGKFVMAVFAGKTATAFEDRKKKAASYNNPQIVYVGNGGIDEDGNTVEGMLMAAHTAGAIAATPSNQAITRVPITSFVDVSEKLKNEQYDESISSGMLLLSMNAEGEVWFDSGCNTLVTLNENQDAGWKKIKRTKVRNELMDRLNRTMEKKVARVNCDPDGVADIIQSGMGVMKAMEGENKLAVGSSQFYEDPDNPYMGDSGWFIVEADDLDKLEKIYLHYRFRANQYA